MGSDVDRVSGGGGWSGGGRMLDVMIVSCRPGIQWKWVGREAFYQRE